MIETWTLPQLNAFHGEALRASRRDDAQQASLLNLAIRASLYGGDSSKSLQSFIREASRG